MIIVEISQKCVLVKFSNFYSISRHDLIVFALFKKIQRRNESH